jgi:hypothetical protein
VNLVPAQGVDPFQAARRVTPGQSLRDLGGNSLRDLQPGRGEQVGRSPILFGQDQVVDRTRQVVGLLTPLRPFNE